MTDALPDPTASAPAAAGHAWKFFRIGGFDQVSIESWDDLDHLGELDQKLWGALSVPARGLAIDERSLARIDADGDGHIRPPELLAALAWAGERLTPAGRAALVDGRDVLPLDWIDAERHPALLSALRHILAGLGKPAADEIAVADTCEAVERFAARPLNGDGIVSPASSDDAELSALIADLALAYAGPRDRNGEAGVDAAIFSRFQDDLAALLAWHAVPQQDAACRPLGASSVAALAALEAVRDKIDDYFARCQLAAFDPRAGECLNGSAEQFRELARRSLATLPAEMAELPLAQVAAGRPLPLAEGLNPAWQARMDAFVAQVVEPLLGRRDALSEADWALIRTRFAACAAWRAAKPQSPLADWPPERLAALADGGYLARLGDLLAADLALQPEAEAIVEADRITRYLRDLPCLVHNFVAFRDFYSRLQPAAFQAGTLYIDGRSCTLCLDVLDPVKHVNLAGLAGIYLLYCDCRRGDAMRQIVAAVTAGDADQILVGRNGVFYDRQGGDWDATVTRIVEHPISLRQAFWSPYKKVAKLAAEQVQKFAAARAQSADQQRLERAVENLLPGSPPPPPKPAFDPARFAGIFAAIGLAVGALGTAVASLITGFLGLKAWQIPLALAGILLVISGPAMALAWFKLRNRSLAALLDANGWAVNARARINLPFGTTLTQLARLPDGARRQRQDPYAEKKRPFGLYVGIGVGLALLAFYLRRRFFA